MKKIFILIIGFLIVSCSKDDSDCPNSISNTNLVSITKNYYSNNVLYDFKKLNFYEQKLINIQYKDGSYDDYQYSNNLVSRILEFDSNDIIERTLTFEYDSEGRVIKWRQIPGSTNTIWINSERTYSYNNNQIICNNTYTGGYMKFVYTLNLNGDIINEKLYDINNNLHYQYITYNYANNNLTNLTKIDTFFNTQEISNYTYTAIKNEFNYNKYLFGLKWKKNYTLTHSQTFPFVSYESEISENLVSSFSDNSRNFLFNYIFNEKNQITKETQNFTATGINARFESIYEYK